MNRILCAAAALTVSALTVSVFPALALAANAPPNYVGVMGSYVFPDSVRGTEDGPAWHVLYGSPMNERLALELNAFGQRTELENGGGYDAAYGAGIDLRYLLGAPRLGAFVLGGLGSVWEDFDVEEELSPYLNVGIGVQAGSDAFQVRAEGRYYAIFNGDTYPDEDVLYDARANLGVLYSFGAAVAGPSEFDRDGDSDGVADSSDRCPDTPLGTPVDTSGCPFQAQALLTDTDGDGVTDDADQCPATPPGTDVDTLGCPVDEDGDGVPNALDACPQTPPGFKVDETGCVREEQTVIVLNSVNFEFNSAKLTRAGRVILDRVAAGLRSQTDLQLEILGHTDSLGSDNYNRQLSIARAASVRNFLVDRGIAGDRLRSAGMGESQPVADNETEEGRAQNRRVEFRVLGN